MVRGDIKLRPKKEEGARNGRSGRRRSQPEKIIYTRSKVGKDIVC